MEDITITLVLVIMTGFISYQAFRNPVMKAKLIFRPTEIHERGEYYRFLTHGFLHANWEHLLLNMFVLYMFGSTVESACMLIFGPTFGLLAYIGFYLSAIIIAAIPDYFRYKDNIAYASLGASGATSALVFAYIFFGPWSWFIYPPLPAIVLAIVYLFYSSYMDKKGTDNIAHNAHFWGAIYGFVFIFVSAQAFQPILVTQFIQELLAGPKWPF